MSGDLVNLLPPGFQTNSGEMAWPKEAIPQVLATCVGLRLAVIGGEIWTVFPDGRIYGDVFAKDGGPAGVYYWSVDCRENESWLDFVVRAANETASEITRLNAEDWTKPELISYLRYNLTISEEGERQSLHNET